MPSCEFNDNCSFLNKKAIAMPLTTLNLVKNYCGGDFTLCTIYKAALVHGIEKVPGYVSPDDQYELSHRIVELVHRDKSRW